MEKSLAPVETVLSASFTKLITTFSQTLPACGRGKNVSSLR